MSLIFLFILLSVAPKTSQNATDSNPVDYIFNVVSVDVEETTIQLFNTLKLPYEFTNGIQKDLDMYTYLKTTTSLNYKKFQDIANITRIACNKDKNNITIIDNAIDEIINGTLNIQNANEIVNNEFRYYIPLITRQTDPDDPDELSLEFIKEFIDKVSDLNLKDFKDDSFVLSKIANDSIINYELSEEILGDEDFEDFSLNEETDDLISATTNENSITNYNNSQNATEYNAYRNISSTYQQNSSLGIDDFIKRRMDVWAPYKESPDYLQPSRRIFNGKRAGIKNFPFMVSIHDDGHFVCGGSIIRKDVVISAASCLERIYLDRKSKNAITSVYIRVGSDYISTGGYLVHATYVIFHPDFNPVTMNNNLVLLYVLKGELARIPWVKRLKFKKEESLFGDLRAGKDHVKILGWGEQTKESIRRSRGAPLVYDHLDVYNLEECRDIYTSHYVTDNNFCAGFLLKGGGACKNDVGGPGIKHGMLIGIISFGPTECGASDKPTVFTKIIPYIDWFHRVVDEVLPKLKPRPPEFFQYNETYDYRRKASFVHGLPQLDKTRKRNNVVALQTTTIKDFPSFESAYDQDEIKSNSRSKSKNRSKKLSKVGKRNINSHVQLSVKFEDDPEDLPPKKITTSSINTDTPKQSTKDELVEKIFVMEYQDTDFKMTNKEKDLIIRYNDPILDYRPDIDSSKEEPKNSLSSRNENSTTKKYIKSNETQNKFISLLAQNFIVTKTLSSRKPKKSKWGENFSNSPTSKSYFFVSHNYDNTSETSTEINVNKTIPEIIVKKRKKYPLTSALRFIVLPDNAGSEENKEYANISYEEYDVSKPQNVSVIVNVTEPTFKNNTMVDLNYYSGLDDDNFNGTNIIYYNHESYEGEYYDDGGLSIEPFKGKIFVEPISKRQAYKNISQFITPFNNIYTTRKSRFKLIKRRGRHNMIGHQHQSEGQITNFNNELG